MSESVTSHPQPGTTQNANAASGAQAPGAANAGSPRQAQAGMPANRRPLETGIRGWRWLVGASLVVLPLLGSAADLDHRIASGQALVAAQDTVELGTPLATPAEASNYIRAAARTPEAAPAWTDVYFDTLTTTAPAPRYDAALAVLPTSGL